MCLKNRGILSIRLRYLPPFRDLVMRAADDATVFKICAAPIGQDGHYHAWPDKITFVRRFPSAEKRDQYWNRYVVPKGTDYHGLSYQIAMVDEWRGGWRFVGRPLYADLPLIGRPNRRPANGHIVEID